MKFTKPIDEIEEMLPELSKEERRKLPKKWEKLGDVLVIKIPDELRGKEKTIARAYAKALKCREVLEDRGIYGKERKPKMLHLYGNGKTETVHMENGIKFKMDVSKVMFSSGNIDERQRMAHISNEKEVVVDLFAGIGYFSIPMAVYSSPRIYACEINPIAFNYLKENIKLNGIEDRVKPLLGNCNEVAPRKIADRVIMGYLDAKDFLPIGIQSLNGKGIIHYHEACPNKLLPKRLFRNLERAIDSFNKRAKILNYKKIKSYAPGVSHIVADVKIW